MIINVVVHIEEAEIDGDREVVWWAESSSAPGFSAAAPTMAELRAAFTRELRELYGDSLEIHETLADHAEPVVTLVLALAG